MSKRFSRRSRRGQQAVERVPEVPPVAVVDSAPPSPPGRFWAIGVLVLSAIVSMSMNTVHAFTATTLPGPLALMYGVAPVALAAMQSHAVALRALRKEKVGAFRRCLTFGLVLGGLGLSFLGIYDLLRHAVPDPIPGVPVHEPAVFFSIVIDLMALAALHELLRESPSFVSAVRATEITTSVVAEAVPAVVGQSPTTEAERVAETPAISSPIGEEDHSPGIVAVPVPDPVEAVPSQVGQVTHVGNLAPQQAVSDVVAPPLFSHEVQPGTEVDESDPLAPVALAKFLPELVGGDLPSVRTIKDAMQVGTDRARRLQAYLGGLVGASR